jgi:hypothetical protein
MCNRSGNSRDIDFRISTDLSRPSIMRADIYLLLMMPEVVIAPSPPGAEFMVAEDGVTFMLPEGEVAPNYMETEG